MIDSEIEGTFIFILFCLRSANDLSLGVFFYVVKGEGWRSLIATSDNETLPPPLPTSLPPSLLLCLRSILRCVHRHIPLAFTKTMAGTAKLNKANRIRIC